MDGAKGNLFSFFHDLSAFDPLSTDIEERDDRISDVVRSSIHLLSEDKDSLGFIRELENEACHKDHLDPRIFDILNWLKLPPSHGFMMGLKLHKEDKQMLWNMCLSLSDAEYQEFFESLSALYGHNLDRNGALIQWCKKMSGEASLAEVIAFFKSMKPFHHLLEIDNILQFSDFATALHTAKLCQRLGKGAVSKQDDLTDRFAQLSNMEKSYTDKSADYLFPIFEKSPFLSLGQRLDLIVLVNLFQSKGDEVLLPLLNTLIIYLETTDGFVILDDFYFILDQLDKTPLTDHIEVLRPLGYMNSVMRCNKFIPDYSQIARLYKEGIGDLLETAAEAIGHLFPQKLLKLWAFLEGHKSQKMDFERAILCYGECLKKMKGVQIESFLLSLPAYKPHILAALSHLMGQLHLLVIDVDWEDLYSWAALHFDYPSSERLTFLLSPFLPVYPSGFDLMNGITGLLNCIKTQKLFLTSESFIEFYKTKIDDPAFIRDLEGLNEQNRQTVIKGLNLLYFAKSQRAIDRGNEYLTPFIHSITLQGQRAFSRTEFEKHVLFNYAKEKSVVFTALWSLIHFNPHFEKEYQECLDNLSREDWFEIYKYPSRVFKEPMFAIIAFLRGDIDKESLLVVHTIAQGCREMREARVFVLSPDDLPDYLAETGFPPFAPATDKHLITHLKSEDELSVVRSEIVREFKGKTPVKRTVIEYPFEYGEDQVENTIYGILECKIGLKRPNIAVLLPPHFTVSLMKKSCYLETPDPEAHFYSFGYSSMDGGPFYQGLRIISIPSPCFEMVRPHNFTSGPPGLGMILHDINYHVPLDINNPQAGLITEIAKEFNPKRSSHLCVKNPKEKEFRRLSLKMAMHLADREANAYRVSHLSMELAFTSYILTILIRIKGAETSYPESFILQWEQEVVKPVIAFVLARESASSTLEMFRKTFKIKESVDGAVF